MKTYQTGDKVTLPAFKLAGLPAQRAVVLSVQRGSLLVQVYACDRGPGDIDGRYEVALDGDGNITHE